VYFRRLEREEFLILKELRAGKTLSRAIESALGKTSIAPEDRAAQIQSWFQTWSTLGWFCRSGMPGKK
jgi:hypothetical protein